MAPRDRSGQLLLLGGGRGVIDDPDAGNVIGALRGAVGPGFDLGPLALHASGDLDGMEGAAEAGGALAAVRIAQRCDAIGVGPQVDAAGAVLGAPAVAADVEEPGLDVVRVGRERGGCDKVAKP